MTPEVALVNTVTTAVAATGGADAAFILQWIGICIGTIILWKLIAPYLPIIGPWLETLDKGTSTLEKAVPALKDKGWWKKGMSVLDFMQVLAGFAKAAELLKAEDPDGTKREALVLEKVKTVMGVKHQWTAEQEAAVKAVLHATLVNEGLVSSCVDAAKAKVTGANAVVPPFRPSTDAPTVPGNPV